MFGKKRLQGRSVGGGPTSDVDALREFTQKLIEKEMQQKRKREKRRTEQENDQQTGNQVKMRFAGGKFTRPPKGKHHNNS